MHWCQANGRWRLKMNTLGMIAIVIDEYDAAIAHYVNDLGFTLIEDK